MVQGTQWHRRHGAELLHAAEGNYEWTDEWSFIRPPRRGLPGTRRPPRGRQDTTRAPRPFAQCGDRRVFKSLVARSGCQLASSSSKNRPEEICPTCAHCAELLRDQRGKLHKKSEVKVPGRCRNRKNCPIIKIGCNRRPRSAPPRRPSGRATSFEINARELLTLITSCARADGQPSARFHARPLRVPSARFTSRTRLRMPRYCPSQTSA